MKNNPETTIKLSHCQTCNRFQYPPRVLCSYCLSDDIQAQAVEAKGTVLADTAIHFSLEEELMETIPNHIGLVKLDIGPTLFAALEEGVQMGDTVTIRQQSGKADVDSFLASLH